MKKRKICVVLVDRANYGRLKPVMRAIQTHPELELQVLASGTMLLGRFSRPVEMLRTDGFDVAGEIYTELEGSTPTTMAKSIGIGVSEFASEYMRLAPDVVLIIGDRYEALAAAIAAAYMNLCVAHVQGGEVSGSIDESARHAISKFAHFHFPSTVRSADYLVRMGEAPQTILSTGCPSSDIARELDTRLASETINGSGNGAFIDVTQPFMLVVFHPTTTEYGVEGGEMSELLNALNAFRMQTVLLWPNIDAGSDHISKVIRMFRDKHNSDTWLRTITNMSPESYLKVLANAACAVGNSSSFVRDAGHFGTPVVLAGRRQVGREHDIHLTPSDVTEEALKAAIGKQLEHGRYAKSTLYGDGFVSRRIADGLARLTPYMQKRLHYIFDGIGDGIGDAANSNQGMEAHGEHASTWDRNGAGRIQGHPTQEPGGAERKTTAGSYR